MLVTNKEQKIKDKIKEITGVEIDINQQFNLDQEKYFRIYKIKKILLISSAYDYFILEEEGRLDNLISEWGKLDEKENPPTIIHAETGEESLKKIKSEHFDIIIIFNKPEDTSVIALSNKIKKITDVPVILLGNDVNELSRILSRNNSNIDKAFTWIGDGKIILSIVQYFEDLKNIEKVSPVDFKKCILLIEDSIHDYSSWFSMIF
jgi:hypothetical protein